MPVLDWIGKKAVVNHHKEVPFHLLKRDDSLSVGDPDSGNLLVEGDNLVALKALLPYYAGQVKCIYIDPPYNTGNEGWVYNDSVNSAEIREWLGKAVGKEAEDLSRHDKWLCMMYPRLQLLRLFLKQDGVILVSIDDFEAHMLRCLLDEIFGRNNFIAQLVWDKTRKNDAKLFSVGHEYVLVYAKSLAFLRAIGTKWRESKPGADKVLSFYAELLEKYGSDYETMEKELKQWYKELPKEEPAKKLSRHKHIDERGVWRDRDISWPGGGGPRYDVIHPVTGKPCKVPERGWGFASPLAMEEQIQQGLVEFRKDEKDPPFRKSYLESSDETDEEAAGPQVMSSVIYKQAQVVAKFLRNMFDGERVFDNPKDHEVLARLIKYVTGPSDIILDSFAGSGSTGQAILQLNSSGGNRRFLLAEMDGKICQEITARRLKKAIEGYSYKSQKGHATTVRGLGGGFRYCALGAGVFDESGNIASKVSFCQLSAHVFFCETGSPAPNSKSHKSPLLGVHNGKAIYLLYNGILKDKTPDGGNVLTRQVLAELPLHKGPKVIYGTSCRIGEDRLQREQITFKQIPYEIKVD
ncbi:MAG: site-specific DNA-methyltransferase [Candidatus Babeliaceae bacterium]|nr:site-specific DNA-methyltransferase [Candidatus Babeliaceae bacterium]